MRTIDIHEAAVNPGGAGDLGEREWIRQVPRYIGAVCRCPGAFGQATQTPDEEGKVRVSNRVLLTTPHPLRSADNPK